MHSVKSNDKSKAGRISSPILDSMLFPSFKSIDYESLRPSCANYLLRRVRSDICPMPNTSPSSPTRMTLDTGMPMFELGRSWAQFCSTE